MGLKRLLVLGLMVGGVSGCSALSSADRDAALKRSAEFVPGPELRDPQTSSSTQSSQADTTGSEERLMKPPSATELDPQVMYEVLLGEMLALKGAQNDAFRILFPLAEQTRDPGLAERAFQLSMATFDLEAIQAATDLWREISPESSVAWKASYLMAVRDGDQSKAREHWDRYRAVSEQTLDQDLVQAAMRLRQTAPAESGLAFMQWLLQTHPEKATVQYGMGLVLHAYQQYSPAIDYLNKAIGGFEVMLSDVTPAWPASLSQQFRNEMAPEGFAQPWLLQVYRQAHLLMAESYLGVDRPQSGLDALADYVEAYPDDWAMQERYARLEVKAGFYHQAEQRYQAVVNHRPDAHQTRLALALLRLEQGDYEGAIEPLEQLKATRSFESAARYYLGRIAQQQGEEEQARAYYESVVDSEYGLDARLHLAELTYDQLGLEATLEQLSALSPESVEDKVRVLRARALFYRKAGQLDQAIDQYQDAIALTPDNVGLYLKQAMLQFEAERFEAYEATLKQALDLAPAHAELLNALGYFYVEQNRELEQATELLDKAVALAPGQFHILDSRGWLAYKKGELKDAERYLRKALSMQMDPEVLAHLIEVLWVDGQKREARALWQKHRSSFPDHEPLQTLIQRLQSS
ncbi:tetratricopeptide repeat protein [Hydrogenovibrio halophilus]|uniref:tetratricopeptide repeat protein n=1 Tax=Hydrogenovibrio halophilus TaxID=373391 RepID=UPI0003A5D73D|nr:tetratricopeptide repeat protein [Hydrogenovibrio halophilus]